MFIGLGGFDIAVDTMCIRVKYKKRELTALENKTLFLIAGDHESCAHLINQHKSVHIFTK